MFFLRSTRYQGIQCSKGVCHQKGKKNLQNKNSQYDRLLEEIQRRQTNDHKNWETCLSCWSLLTDLVFKARAWEPILPYCQGKQCNNIRLGQGGYCYRLFDERLNKNRMKYLFQVQLGLTIHRQPNGKEPPSTQRQPGIKAWLQH